MEDPGEDKLDDNAVIDLIRIGGKNTRYFEIIYNRYFDRVKNKSYSIVRNRQEALDLTEEIMVKIFEKLDTYKGTAKFSTWAYSLTYNHCIDFLRVKKNLHYPKWDNDQELSIIPENIEEINEEFDYDKLMKVLEELHTEEQVLLRMKYIDNISLKNIGLALRITESAVKMRLKRARTRLLYLYKSKHFND
ncbi:sigma-70 family RNA polymerase sigma factor [Fulvivirga sp.]|uniref:RNA polymerase sigma factor n=1 Tax=Fulvivirga sp. TaxID=1931237 RepID=UPI0032EDB482